MNLCNRICLTRIQSDLGARKSKHTSMVEAQGGDAQGASQCKETRKSAAAIVTSWIKRSKSSPGGPGAENQSYSSSEKGLGEPDPENEECKQEEGKVDMSVEVGLAAMGMNLKLVMSEAARFEVERIYTLARDKKLLVLDADSINFPNQIPPKGIAPILIYVRIPSTKVLGELIKYASKSVLSICFYCNLNSQLMY